MKADRELLAASLGILALLTAIKHLQVVPAVATFGFTLAALAQVLVPHARLRRGALTERELGLAEPGTMAKDLRLAAVLGGLTVVPFLLGHHVWQVEILHRAPALPALTGAAALAAGEAVLVQVVAVAWPEELYFRGYLQGLMERRWPPAQRFLGAPIGVAIVLSSVVFGLAHFLGEYNPLRLGPFFPSLVFGWLRARTGRITAPIAYHAFCNLLADLAHRAYR